MSSLTLKMIKDTIKKIGPLYKNRQFIMNKGEFDYHLKDKGFVWDRRFPFGVGYKFGNIHIVVSNHTPGEKVFEITYEQIPWKIKLPLEMSDF